MTEVIGQHVEVQVRGFGASVREMSLQDAPAVAAIDSGLSAKEYRGLPKVPGLGEAKRYLKNDVVTSFSPFGEVEGKDNVFGAVELGAAVAKDTVIGIKSDKEAGVLVAYIIETESEDAQHLKAEQKGLLAEKNVDVSYVDGVEDSQRKPDVMAEHFLEAAVVMVNMELGTSKDKISEKLIPDQIASASKKLAIFADAGTGEDEAKYREGLEMAGFVEVNKFEQADEDDGGIVKEYVTYHLPIETLAAKLQAKASMV